MSKVIPGIEDLIIVEGANIDDTFVVGHTNKDLSTYAWRAKGFEAGSNTAIFDFDSAGSGLTINSASATETNLTLSATGTVTDAYDFESGYWYMEAYSGANAYRYLKGKVHFNRKNS